MRNSLLSLRKQGYMLPISRFSDPQPGILMHVSYSVANCWHLEGEQQYSPPSGLLYIVPFPL